MIGGNSWSLEELLVSWLDMRLESTNALVLGDGGWVCLPDED